MASGNISAITAQRLNVCNEIHCYEKWHTHNKKQQAICNLSLQQIPSIGEMRLQPQGNNKQTASMLHYNAQSVQIFL